MHPSELHVTQFDDEDVVLTM